MHSMVRVLARLLVGALAGAAVAFVAALLRPQRRDDVAPYVAPVPPGALKV